MKYSQTNYLLLTLIVFCITACATNPQSYYDQGRLHLANKNYQQARLSFYKCAETRHPACMNMMGVTNLQSGQKQEAIEWFNLAARFDSEDGRMNLRLLDQPIPSPDLAIAYSQPAISNPRMVTPVPMKKSTSKYESSMGTRYQYDMADPLDRINYSVDIDAQLRDRIGNLNPIHGINQGLEKSIGEQGAGVYD